MGYAEIDDYTYLIQVLGRLAELFILVDGRQLPGHVVVEPVKHDDQTADAGREAEEPLLREAVRLEQAVLKRPHEVLLLLVRAVEGAEVEVRRGGGDGGVLARGAEDVVDDESGQVEQHAGDLAWVRLETPIVAAHQRVEELRGVRLRRWQQRPRLYRTSVGGSRLAQVREVDVVVSRGLPSASRRAFTGFAVEETYEPSA